MRTRLLIALLALVALPATASAATSVSKAGDRLFVTAGTGFANDVSLSLDRGTFTVTDAGDTVTAGDDCSPTGAHSVTCSQDGIVDVTVAVGDRDDRVVTTGDVISFVYAGSGNDTLSTTATVFGTHLHGEAGNDVLTGGPTGDTLNGGPGSDVLTGGGGWDTAWYLSRTAPVNVSLDGLANDGEAGEGDNAKTDIEAVIGGDGNDTLTGSAAANRLSGSAGHDTLRGAGGADHLSGAGGRDVLDGGAGADSLEGGLDRDRADYSARTVSVVVDIDGVADDGQAGEGDNVALDVEGIWGGSRADTLTGSAAADTLVGGAGSDHLFGLAGDDFLDTFDGVSGNDYLSGSTGFDGCDFDDGDRAFGCG